MTFVKQIGGAALGAAMLLGAGLCAPPAQAGFIMDLTQVGSNVVATGSGTFDLAGLSLLCFGCGTTAAIFPSIADIATGLATGSLVDIYGGFTGPASFGSGGPTFTSSGSGDVVEILGLVILGVGSGELSVPAGYVSGSALSDTSTYDGQTFASLGATVGTYVWTWGSGATADSFTLDVGVPEPASLALLGAALLLGGIVLNHRQRRYS